MCWGTIGAKEPRGWIGNHLATFRCQDYLLSLPFDGLPNDFLAGVWSIHISSVQHCDPLIQRMVNQTNRLCFGNGSVGPVTEAHASQSERTGLKAAWTKGA